MTVPDYLQFWGKAHADEGRPVKWHPAAYHCLDVAAVAQRLQEQRRKEAERMSARLDLSADDFIKFSTYLIALHDLGKFSRSFQALAADIHWPTKVLGPCPDEHYSGSHWQISYYLLASKPTLPRLLETLGIKSHHALRPLLRAVAGHHGQPPDENTPIDDNQLGSACEKIATTFLADLTSLLSPPQVPKLDSTIAHTLSHWLAGLTVAADWLGSNSEIFQYSEPDLSITEYWQTKAEPSAAQVIDKAGLASALPAPNADLKTLFDIPTPRPMQQAMASLPLPDDPMLVIIEDATGSGKTEAATLLAQRMMAAGKAGGLYFALPTMATANAMFTRMGKDYRNLFVDEAKPSLALAHGRRALDKRWYSAITMPQNMSASLSGPNEETAAQCAQWIADDRRKTFFAQIGVGTIDQALLCVLPSKFAALRLWGLSDRILIVDEAHAYDAYMSKELETLLTFHAANGGSAIILSATLPAQKRASLAQTFQQGLGEKHAETLEANPAYPLVTITSLKETSELTHIQPAAHTMRKVYVERLDSLDVAIEAIVSAANKGAAVAFVRNAVDDAIKAVELLRQRGIDADLFHARYAMGQRQQIETQQVERFGKEGQTAERAGRVLVATQVIEQSLDLDFDLMVSDLAPIDLLIQRAGRLWRHMDKRPAKERPVEGPKLLVVSPDPAKVKDKNWLNDLGHTGRFVYPNHALLWRTAHVLFAKTGFEAPNDLREMIETVYGDPPAENTPDVLTDLDMEADGENWGDRANAQFNLLKLEEGYARTGSWLEEDCVRTRLGEPTTTTRLAQIKGDRLIPFCTDEEGRPSWPLSEISINAKWVEGAQPAAKWRKAAMEAGKDWPKWQQKILVAPVDEGGRLLLEGLGGDDFSLVYRQNGLEKDDNSM